MKWDRYIALSKFGRYVWGYRLSQVCSDLAVYLICCVRENEQKIGVHAFMDHRLQICVESFVVSAVSIM